MASVTKAWKRRGIAFVAAGVALAAVLTTAGLTRPPGVPRLYAQGIAWQPCSPDTVLVVPAATTAGPGGRPDDYVPGTAVLRSQARTACARRRIDQDRQWLGSGQVPGDTPALKAVATRALLDLLSHLLRLPRF